MTDFGPAGHDRALATALLALDAQQWTPTRDLLAATGTNWELRTARIAILAAAAQGSTVTETWLSEEPESRDARVLRAAVSVERARRAAALQLPQASAYYHSARTKCLEAARKDGADPAPWVTTLALASLDIDRLYPESRAPHPDRAQMVPHGPWAVLDWVQRRHPFNREAFHHGAEFVRAVKAPEIDFIAWALSRPHLPDTSALHVLPLYAMLRQKAYQQRNPAWPTEWSKNLSQDAIGRAYHWFTAHSDPQRDCRIDDLSYLALALWSTGEFELAHSVFEVMGPYASLAPFYAAAEDDRKPAAQADRAERLFHTVHSQCYKITRSRRRRQAPEGSRRRHAQPDRPNQGVVSRLLGGNS
ncbi:hypothetical protein ACFV19_20865 [Streptomyces griseoluteus]|uniref:hypothetical protein n=1 Tax=Streptomyces griseoluteus TaxID=29306 RepID=UPI0036860CF1